MTRGERRRRQWAARKGRLSRDDARALDKKRRLPNFPDTFDTEDPIWTVEEQVRPVLALIRRSGVVRSLEPRLRNHTGNESRISLEAVLLAMMLAAKILKSYRRTDVCAILNGLPTQIAYELGLWDPDNPPPISYHSVCKQIKRLENALGATWTGTDDTVRDLDWLCHTLIAATIPRKHRKKITAASMDSKIIESWGVSKIYVKEKDALAEHRLKERERIDMPEPTLPTVTGPITNKIGEPGPDGRVIRSHDLHARLGYKSATNREKAHIVLGYDLHLLTSVPSVTWTGDPRTLASKHVPPKYIIGMSLAPGSTNPGPIGLDLVARAMQITPGIKEVVADRGYTNKRKTFCRELHKQGINTVMDYNPGEIPKPKSIKAGRNDKQQLLLHLGSFFPPWLPESLQAPPQGLTDKKLEEWYTDRALWRWTVHKYLKNGGVQLVCPQCAGRVKTSAKTRNPSATPNKDPLPFLRIDDEYCCEGKISVPVNKLDGYQSIPSKTPAWKRSYKARRNNSENKNSMLGDKANFALGWCRVFNQFAFTIGALVKVIIHNLAETIRFRKTQPKHTTPVTGTETPDTPSDETPPPTGESPRAPP